MSRRPGVRYLPFRMRLIGVGEIGHHILQAMERRKTFPSAIFLSDPDVVSKDNPSFAHIAAAEGRQPIYKVNAVIPMLLQYYSVVVVRQIPASLQDGRAYIYNARYPSRWTGSDELIVECTDDAGMLELEAVHVHTGLVTNIPAGEIWYGSRKGVKSPPHPPDACRQALSEAARHLAEVLVERLSALQDWRDIREFKYSFVQGRGELLLSSV